MVCMIITSNNYLFKSTLSLSEANEDGCTEGEVRLVNSTLENEGRVEVCHRGSWGLPCNIGQIGAYVVCKSLGYDAGDNTNKQQSIRLII